MAVKRYYIRLLALVGFVILSCLLILWIFTRTIGDLDSNDTEGNGGTIANSQRLYEEPPIELEPRVIDLVDLVESGKTFAYTRVRLQVMVPINKPIYKQKAPIGRSITQEPGVTKPMSPTATGGNDDSQQSSKFVLTQTQEAVAVDLDENATDTSQTQLNRTLVDCFIVDTEKRLNQRRALEEKFKLVAITRRVNLKRMIDIIAECRLLTWSTLDKAAMIGDMTEPATDSEVAPPPSAQPSSSSSSSSPSSLPADRVDVIDHGNDIQAAIQPAGNATDSAESIGAMINNWLHGAESQRDIQQTTGSDVDEQRRQSYLNMGLTMISGVVPNTLWCGLGDRASNYSELGVEYKVDSCCRAHDHCPIRLKPFGADYGLVNWSVSTRSHCDCDLDFSNCLNHVNTTLSNVIRILYFRFVGVQCIDVEGRRTKDRTATT